MDFELIDKAKDYWIIARRYHANRANRAMRPAAVHDMLRLQGSVSSEAVRRRVNSFIGLHRQKPPTNSDNGGGPSVA